MANLESRIAELETKHNPKGQIDVIVTRFIRPGDMACVGEYRWTRDSKVWEVIQPFDDTPFKPDSGDGGVTA